MAGNDASVQAALDEVDARHARKVEQIKAGILAAAAEGHPIGKLADVLHERGFPTIQHNTSAAFREAVTGLIYQGKVGLTEDRRVVAVTAPTEEAGLYDLAPCGRCIGVCQGHMDRSPS